MRLDIAALTLIAFIAPALAAQTYDVNIVNGKFSPQVLDVAPGDTVRWPLNDGADHAIVQTEPGPRSCNSLPGGFNSGRKTSGQSYQRTFPNQTVVNYKDGIGANCANGATGTIYVGPRPANATETGSSTTAATATTTSTVSASSTMTSTMTASASPSPSSTNGGGGATTTTTGIIPTPTHHNNADGLSAQSSLILGIAGLIGAFVAF
ncbi:hypothetical protein BC939DRAFT_435578 [Gamsiella multidivaricata]|uniref:uncharacterized protein n=1 Tax=Gamsiella multidivaricata TaxID=101098 RepID=UPI00221F1FAA|nr:uncharacterized protein BC939DRAFT_435578 [Gamsiella multidivaricata]KAG0360256.1 hypothetical protein BGZ54_009643 [Gamsiella multidivaricata]KAI7832467.1 hypothetical protein BC939DRAFT_435578 [Gamsiella multidivaricata]